MTGIKTTENKTTIKKPKAATITTGPSIDMTTETMVNAEAADKMNNNA